MMYVFRQVTLRYLQEVTSKDTSIIWVGSISDNIIGIRLYSDINDEIVKFDINELVVPKTKNIIKHNEATCSPLSFVGVTWQKTGWLRSLRIASIYGINIGSRCTPGTIEPKPIPNKCSMGYDIETSQSLVKDGGFPPPYSKITSIALWCTCGYCKAWTTIKHKGVHDLVYCKSSRDLVLLSFNSIKEHMPQWLVGYNCYQFDNCSLLYHSPKEMKSVFKPINTGAKSISRDAFYIDLVGINNVDLYCYLDKCLRREYSALSLGDVAKHHGVGGKTQMPTTDSEETLYQLIDYNINDSMITSKLWYVSKVCDRVVKSCIVSSAPLIDCIRSITGTMVSCCVSSYLISKNSLMDWSECDLRIGYEGGTVLEPIKSIFRNVTVCDFSSMYPTIIQDICISPENIFILSNCSKIHEDKIIYWNGVCTLACIKGKIIKFNKNQTCLSRNILSYQKELRNHYKTIDKLYSDQIKVMSNSFYGAFGFASSPLHSPRCAATVTVAGRTALALASYVFSNLGLKVVYGDTDSCFLASGKYTAKYFENSESKHIDTALYIFHNILKYTPFPSMRMEKESMYKSILLIDKKHYAYADFNNNIKTKGLSHTRKDRLGICREMTSMVAEKVLLLEDIEEARNIIVEVINRCYSAITSGILDTYSISKEVRYEGNSCYRYTDPQGEVINVPVARSDKSKYIKYSSNKVIEALEKDMNRLCIPAGLGPVSKMLLDANI